ncbi:hypothetical protein KUTeg_018288 [Tegillarca granosa]|uniref:Mutator-like transposase domain-containing protein n=1 Tax=Tegillarca granosa TaxID=220873 RepID=A0ABQ9EME2_TEGGR|nr:hypothetical protein KUTeg_018288 [Tegillarca granosa]
MANKNAKKRKGTFGLGRDITKHTITCKHLQHLPKGSPCSPPIKLLKEVRTTGLASVLLCACEGCKEKFRFKTSPQVPLQHSKHYDVNIRSVWGAIVTRNGESNLNELMGTRNSPGMSQQTFSVIEQEIGDLLSICVEEDLIQAGAEERRIAIEKGHYDDGVACITVIADGGWSKRSHWHSYNALGGVGVIIGAETECVNHICKCLRTNLEKLVDENLHYKGKGKLSKAARVKIVSAVRCANLLTTGENNSKSAATMRLEKLEKDIHNCVHHVFGDHRNCTDFCKVKNEEQHTATSTQIQLLRIIKKKNQEETGILKTLDALMIKDISLLLNRVAAKSSRLIGNYTTNLAES